MASGGDNVTSNVAQISQVQNTVTQHQQEKTAGVPLSDFVLQLEDYAPTVIIQWHLLQSKMLLSEKPFEWIGRLFDT